MTGGPQPVPVHPARPDLLVPLRVDRSGLVGPTPDQVKGKGWRRTSRGYYLPIGVPRSVEQRIVEAATVLPGVGGVTGWAALRWLGAGWFDGLADAGRTERRVPLAAGSGCIRPQAGIQIVAERLGPADLTAYAGLNLTSPARSVLFEMRYAADVREAVVALDMAAFDNVVSIDEARQHASGLQTFTGIPQARAALQLADENSWSPQETRLRMCWVLDAGLGRPECNLPIFDLSGRHIGTPDLFDPASGLIGEYDGGIHLTGRQRSRDVAREDRFRDHGLEYFTVVAGDLRDPERVVARLRAALHRARWTPPGKRSWTIEPPRSWTSSRSVEIRRTLPRRRNAR